MNTFKQNEYNIRFEWGLRGVTELAPVSDVVVIVDTLSFSTAVDIALTRGAIIYPYRYKDATLVDFAGQTGAEFAVSRTKMDDKHPYSLSPVSLYGLNRGDRLVLPSPNGGQLSLKSSELCKNVYTACLRNAEAVAEKAVENGDKIAVIAAGERWDMGEGEIRFALEDLLGAGAIISAIDFDSRSPESRVAESTYVSLQPVIDELMLNCVSGRELKSMGFTDDVKLACEINVSETVPQLINNSFVSI